jgi:hypothetical protein
MGGDIVARNQRSWEKNVLWAGARTAGKKARPGESRRSYRRGIAVLVKKALKAKEARP